LCGPADAFIFAGKTYLDDGVLVNHRSSYQAFAFGKNYVMYENDNKIHELSNDVFDDDGDPIKRVRTSPHIHNEHNRIR
jgi:ABC-type molybdate transport system substrate-binding protein